MRLVALVATAIVVASTALAQTSSVPPVTAVLDGRFAIGDAQLPIFVSQNWSQALPAIRRVVIVVHGFHRNADDYARNMIGFGPPPDTLIVAPQFLAAEDVAAHHLPDAMLRWDREQWSDGNPALGPASL